MFFPTLRTVYAATPFNVLADIERLFDSSAVAFGRARARAIQLEASEATDAYRVTAEVPGVRKEDLKITVAENAVTLQIVGSAEGSEPGQVARPRCFGERLIRFSAELAEDGHEARLENGVLTLTLKKRASLAPKIIEVTVQ